MNLTEPPAPATSDTAREINLAADDPFSDLAMIIPIAWNLWL